MLERSVEQPHLLQRETLNPFSALLPVFGAGGEKKRDAQQHHLMEFVSHTIYHAWILYSLEHPVPGRTMP